MDSNFFKAMGHVGTQREAQVFLFAAVSLPSSSAISPVFCFFSGFLSVLSSFSGPSTALLFDFRFGAGFSTSSVTWSLLGFAAAFFAAAGFLSVLDPGEGASFFFFASFLALAFGLLFRLSFGQGSSFGGSIPL